MVRLAGAGFVLIGAAFLVILLRRERHPGRPEGLPARR
jgi:hypothetical protein